MALKIETYTNLDATGGWRPGNNFGGSSLFKALGHPKVAPLGTALATRLKGFKRLAIYDPEPAPMAEAFASFFDLSGARIAGLFVQRVEDLGAERLGQIARPVTELPKVEPDAIFIAAFDAGFLRSHIAPLIPAGCAVVTLDDMRLPQDMLSNKARYLDAINFATNFAFLRDDNGLHTRVATANYWGGYGANDAALWLCLFDGEGQVLAEWTETLPGPNHTIGIDSRDVRKRFNLGPFAGSLFIHAIRIKGHDVVKYALDIFSGDGSQLSCTHDANAWPADFYSGIPAPEAGEKLTLWIQNSHPVAIPAGGVGANAMGSQDVRWLDRSIPPFGTMEVDLGAMLPELKWPAQIEIQAGRYFVRPRYEVVRKSGKRRIAHANVERTDLKPDANIPKLGAILGKGYVMPLPVLPVADWHSVTLPTPMATGQRELPISVSLIDGDGSLVAEKFLGRVQRHESVAVDTDAWLRESGTKLPSGFGHVEYTYDFRDGGEADGWLHALGRYEQRTSGHTAETIFGAHIYNVPVIYKDEPQSYTHRPPGLTTRLYLRIGDAPLDTICHLVFPASLPASVVGPAASSTRLVLHDAKANEIAQRDIRIARNGSRFWRYSEMFSAEERARAGNGAWVQVRDTTCRLFGFHGLVAGEKSFCIDHMFGF